MMLLISFIILETAIVAALTIGLVSLYKEVRQKRANSDQIIGALAEHERETAECRRLCAEAENSLATYHDWYRRLLGGLQDIVLVHGLDEQGMPACFTEVSDAACMQLLYTKDELLSMSIIDIYGADLPPALMGSPDASDHIRKLSQRVVSNTIDKVLKNEHVAYDATFRNSEGKKLPFSLDVIRCDFLDQPMIMWIGRDVSAIKEGQRAVRESERRVRDFFSYSPLGIAMFDSQRGLTAVNMACLAMLGIPDQREFERFSLLDNPFLPPDAKQTLAKAESVRCEIVVDFDDVRRKGMFSSSRLGKAHYEVFISNLGYDSEYEYKPRGYFAQIQDVTQKRKTEADLRKFHSRSASKDEGGISGNLNDVPLTDMVQILCAGGKNMEIEISARNIKAHVFISNGNITHSDAGDKIGEEAFYELMTWKEGQFTASPREKMPTPTIKVSAMSLLMEGARRFDEG